MKKRQLLLHQKKALDYALPLSRIALFMEMRLGKTLVAIRWAEGNKLNPILVVCPKQVIPPWIDELQKEGYTEPQYQIIQGNVEQRIALAENPKRWNIVNYEALLSTPEIFAMRWDAVILDESTRIRNPQAQITKLVNTQFQMVLNRAILTGLPCPESEMDYFEQFRFVHGKFMDCYNFWKWRQIYYMQLGFNWEIKPSLFPRIKDYVAKNAFILSRKQAKMGSKKIHEKRYVPSTPEQQKMYKEIKNEFQYTLQGKTPKQTGWKLVTLTWLAQVASGFSPEKTPLSSTNRKAEEVLDLLKGELKGEKIVIWFHFNHELEFIYNALKQRGFSIGKYTAESKLGLTPANKIHPSVQIILAQPRCAMMGLDWSSASTAIYFSNWWDGELRAQTEDRIIHPKKKEPVLYIDLLTEGSIDIHVLKLLEKKKLTAKAFMEGLAKEILDEKNNN